MNSSLLFKLYQKKKSHKHVLRSRGDQNYCTLLLLIFLSSVLFSYSLYAVVYILFILLLFALFYCTLIPLKSAVYIQCLHPTALLHRTLTLYMYIVLQLAGKYRFLTVKHSKCLKNKNRRTQRPVKIVTRSRH